MSLTNILERDLEHLVQKAKDFGRDPISVLKAKLNELEKIKNLPQGPEQKAEKCRNV